MEHIKFSQTRRQIRQRRCSCLRSSRRSIRRGFEDLEPIDFVFERLLRNQELFLLFFKVFIKKIKIFEKRQKRKPIIKTQLLSNSVTIKYRKQLSRGSSKLKSFLRSLKQKGMVNFFGGVTQLVECQICILKVVGSSPVTSILWCCSSAGQSICLLSRGSAVRARPASNKNI